MNRFIPRWRMPTTRDMLNIKIGAFLISKRIVFTVWVATLIWGVFLSADFQLAPAPAEFTPDLGAASVFPESVDLEHSHDRPILIMFLHPFCPCSHASLSEFVNVLAESKHPYQAHILFYVSSKFTQRVEDTRLWRQATGASQVTVHLDTDGEIARKFGALTSGSVVVYDTAGRLAFAGGVTRSRGDIGKNLGTDAVSIRLKGGNHVCALRPVYGCPLMRSSCPNQESVDETRKR